MTIPREQNTPLELEDDVTLPEDELEDVEIIPPELLEVAIVVHVINSGLQSVPDGVVLQQSGPFARHTAE